MNDPHMQLVYFFSAVLLALLPVAAFAGLAVWLFRKYLQERAAERVTPSPPTPAPGPRPTGS